MARVETAILESAPRFIAVREGPPFTTDNLIVLVSLARDQHGVAFPRNPDRQLDRTAAIDEGHVGVFGVFESFGRDALELAETLLDVGQYALWILGSGVVTRRDDPVAMPCDRLGHV